MLGENIKLLRKNKGLTQEELAIRLHVVRQTVSKWEKGLSVPDAAVLQALADVLEVPVSKLLGEPVETETEQDRNQVAEQLARINEQLAIKNRRARIIWRTVAIVFIAFMAVMIILPIAGIVLFTVTPVTSTENGVYVYGDERYFEATVLEITEEQLVIEPADGYSISEYADRICILTENIRDFMAEDAKKIQVGTAVGIEFDGSIQESDMMQIDTVSHIEILNETD